MRRGRLAFESLKLYKLFLQAIKEKPSEKHEELRRWIRKDFEYYHSIIPKSGITAAEYQLRLGYKKLERLKSSSVTGVTKF